ncbi:hypothetical protein QF042_001941 [Pedobacter sp. W3I1]|nr:hypothetical protein [Pedobacter sp. W3I1]
MTNHLINFYEEGPCNLALVNGKNLHTILYPYEPNAPASLFLKSIKRCLTNLAIVANKSYGLLYNIRK